MSQDKAVQSSRRLGLSLHLHFGSKHEAKGQWEVGEHVHKTNYLAIASTVIFLSDLDRAGSYWPVLPVGWSALVGPPDADHVCTNISSSLHESPK